MSHAGVRALWALDPACVFLNHGSFGACQREVLAHQGALRAQLEAQPVRFFLDAYEPLLDASRERLATFVGADPERLVFVPNATSGVNAILRSLRFQEGDEVVVTSHGYRACTNALAFAAERAGARVLVADIPFPGTTTDGVIHALDALVGERTRLVLVDHVTSATGLVFPIASIVSRFEARGVPVLVDGAHAPGMLDLDIDALGASWYVGNAHKWLCAPKGAAFVVPRADRVSGLRPLAISHGATMDGSRMPRPRSRLHLEFDWAGTDDPTPWICVGFAIDAFERSVPGGWTGFRARSRALARDARDRLCERFGIPHPATDAMLASLAALPLPDDPESPAPHPYVPHRLQHRLWDAHRIEIPVSTYPRWPGRTLRVSAAAYTVEDDIAALLQALEAELR